MRKVIHMYILSFLEKLRILALDTLFPIFCVSCRKEGEWICPECLGKIEIIDLQVCPYCEKIITENGVICPRCQNSFSHKKIAVPLDALLVSAKYNENELAKIIHLFKYSFARDLSIPLGKLIVSCFSKNSLPLPDVIIPIPLHPRRLRWRDFNQSELLARYLGQNLAPGLDIPVGAQILKRKRFTQPQMKIKNYAERKENLKNAFTIINHSEIHPVKSASGGLATQEFNRVKNKTVLLVDDVCTTGSTLLECAKILKQNGARKVFGAVIARQEIK